MVWSFFYVALCRVLQLVVLMRRSERSKELERDRLAQHELAIKPLLFSLAGDTPRDTLATNGSTCSRSSRRSPPDT